MLAQGLLVLASPILTRLYGPAAFGVFALFSSLTGIIDAVICLRYELAIMLPENDADGANLLAGSFGIATLISSLTIPAIWLGGPALARWLNAPQIVPYLWWIPLVLFFGGIGAGHPALNAWASRTRNFKEISITRVVGTIAVVGTQLSIGLSGFSSAGGLIEGTLVGSILSPILLGWRIWRQDHRIFIEGISWKGIWENLQLYRKFPFYNTFATLLNTISWQVPSFLLAAFFSTTVVGYYALGNQLLRVPMDLIGYSVGQAFFSHAATARNDGTLPAFVVNTFRRLVEYSFFPILILMVIGRELFVIVFGSQWAEAGVYTQILSVWMCFWFISSPLSGLFSILEKNEYSFGINIVVLVSRIAAIWLGAFLGSARLAIALFSLTGVLVYGYMSFWVMVMAGVSWAKLGRILLNNLALFAPAGGLLILMQLLGFPGWVQVLAAGGLIGIYYLYRFYENDEPWSRSVKLWLRRRVPGSGKS